MEPGAEHRLPLRMVLAVPRLSLMVLASCDLDGVLWSCRWPGGQSHPRQVTQLAGAGERGLQPREKAQRRLSQEWAPSFSQHPHSPPRHPQPAPRCRPLTCLCSAETSCVFVYAEHPGHKDRIHLPQPWACDPSSSPQAAAYPDASTAHSPLCSGPTWRVSLRACCPAFPTRERPQWSPSPPDLGGTSPPLAFPLGQGA